MDDQRKSLIVTAAITLLLLALIVALIMFLVRFVQNRAKTSTSVKASPGASVISNQVSVSPRGLSQSSPQPQGGSQADNVTKIYMGPGVRIPYPASWGILTCNNSQNIEFDPTSSTNQFKVPCNRALKSVTILMGGAPVCPGDNVAIGNIRVVKSKIIDDNGTDYRWCTQTTPVLDITHRVSKLDGTATSKQDYSAQVEDIIKNLQFGS